MLHGEIGASSNEFTIKGSVHLASITDLSEREVQILTIHAYPISDSFSQDLLTFLLRNHLNWWQDSRLPFWLLRHIAGQLSWTCLSDQMHRFTINIFHSFNLGASITFESSTKIVVLALRTNPPSFWETKISVLLV